MRKVMKNPSTSTEQLLNGFLDLNLIKHDAGHSTKYVINE